MPGIQKQLDYGLSSGQKYKQNSSNSMRSMRLIERALPLAPDPNFHTLRVLSALALGDGDRVLESSRHISTSIRSDLATADVEGYTVSIQELARMRQNLTVITNHLRGDLDIQDSERVGSVLDDINDRHREHR